MIRKILKYDLLYTLFSLYFVFFIGWMQFHHGHDAEEYLEQDDNVTRVEILSIHHHSVDDLFPLIEHHKIVIKPHFDCPLCAANWLFHGLPDAQSLAFADLSFQRFLFTSLNYSSKLICNYYLRAPPLS